MTESCTIFSYAPNLSKVYHIIKTTYKSHEVSIQGTPSDWTKINVNTHHIRLHFFVKTLSDRELAEMLTGIYKFFEQVQTPYSLIKMQLLNQIPAVQLAVGVVARPKITDYDYKQCILKITQALEGIIFGGGDSMLNPQGELLLDIHGNSDIEPVEQVSNTNFMPDTLPAQKLAQLRKVKNENILLQQGIPVYKSLPPIINDQKVIIRDKHEIAQRAIALCIVALKAEGLEGKKINQFLKRFKANDFLTAKEQKFIQEKITKQTDKAHFSWQYECYWVLLWVLGYVDKLDYPSSICDVASAASILQESSGYRNFLGQVRPRTTREILDEADLTFRYYQACIYAQRQQQAAPSHLDPEVVYERHYTFHWLISEKKWDSIVTDD